MTQEKSSGEKIPKRKKNNLVWPLNLSQPIKMDGLAKSVEAVAVDGPLRSNRSSMLKVIIFPAENWCNGHANVTTTRDQTTATAMGKYYSWLGRNTGNDIEVEDIQVDNSTMVDVPNNSSWCPLMKCVIVVKYRGNAVE